MEQMVAVEPVAASETVVVAVVAVVVVLSTEAFSLKSKMVEGEMVAMVAMVALEQAVVAVVGQGTLATSNLQLMEEVMDKGASSEHKEYLEPMQRPLGTFRQCILSQGEEADMGQHWEEPSPYFSTVLS